MPWPPALVHEFDLVDPGTPKESDYYGPYNSLLHYLFPISQDFLIFPQPKGPVFPDTAEDATIFVVTAEQHPVFFLEVKPWRDINDLRARGVTDREMRERFQRLIGELRLPKLYGLSAMGPRYAVYEYTAATSAIEPKAIPPHPRLVNDIAPVSRWDNDLLTDVGEIKIRSVVRTVKEMRQEARQSSVHALALRNTPYLIFEYALRAGNQ